MSDSDLIKLYSGRILELAADVPLTEPLAHPDATARRRSPLCGSTVTVAVTLRDGHVSGYSQDVRACALGQAAAAVTGAAIIGCTEAQVIRARDQLRAMLTEGGPVPDAPFAELGVLLPAREFRNRHASILLALEAAVEAIAAARASACA
jgi:NifU-like protein involved in Fe-S cluster formation